jgi:GNAT superfamily N-acetyltransferase
VALLICRLEKPFHIREQFDCGDGALNDYLKRYAWQNQQTHRVGITYVAADQSQPQVVIGYYTLAMSEITSDSLPDKLKRLPYLAIPAILLARLAVDLRFRGRGLGRHLLADALDRALFIGNQVGCRCLIVDAYPAAVGWYRKFGLIEIEGARPGASHTKMFIDLRTIAKAKRTPVAAILENK